MAKTTYAKGDLVLVHWLDAARRDGWELEDAKIPDAAIFSVGFVHVMPKDDNGHITIAGDIDIEDGANGRKIRIPMGCLQSVKKMRIPK